MTGVGVGAAVGCAGRDRVIDMCARRNADRFSRQNAGHGGAVHGALVRVAACVVIVNDGVGNFGMVRQQWLVDDGNIDALPGDAAGLQRPHTEAGASARFQ